jgi:hypothetical protein
MSVILMMLGAILVTIPVWLALKVLRIKHNYDFESLARFMVGVTPVAVFVVLFVCRYFSFWPFSN